jgi:NADH-quinone oxidoreductase subunit B
MEGLWLLREYIGNEQRPLSWVMGPQGVVKPTPPVLRDLKREGRRATTVLRPPDEV